MQLAEWSIKVVVSSLRRSSVERGDVAPINPSIADRGFTDPKLATFSPIFRGLAGFNSNFFILLLCELSFALHILFEAGCRRKLTGCHFRMTEA